MYLTLLAGALVLAVDQFTKKVVLSELAEGQSALITSWLRIRHVLNRRGMPMVSGRRAQALLWVILFAGICLIEWHGHFFQKPAAQIGLGFAIGGAEGNACDRFRRNAVVDFIDFGWWPVFNLADAAITIGVAAALWFLR